MKRPFTKPPLTHEQQVALLERRGLIVEDKELAAFYLAKINYYRLAAYWLPFEADHQSHVFKPDTSFEQILELYIFDRELRLLMLDALERIEIAVRSTWAFELAQSHGPHAHLDEQLARRADRYSVNRTELEKQVKRSNELFIGHLRKTYVEPLPPIWAVCEVMSLNLLSRWYANLKPRKLRNKIARTFDLDHEQLQSWLHHLVPVRNICTHHSRLWNREFTVIPAVPRTRPIQLLSRWNRDSRGLYNTLLLSSHFMDSIAPGHTWSERLRNHLERLPSTLLKQMGFHENATPADF